MTYEKPTLENAVKAVREVALDLSPVACYSYKKQGFALTVAPNDLTVTDGTESHNSTLTDTKLYEQLNFLALLEDSTVTLSMDYAPMEDASELVEVSDKALDSAYTILRERYFTTASIKRTMLDFFLRYYYDHRLLTNSYDLEGLYGCIDFAETQKLILFTAFYLLEEKRKNYAANKQLRKLNNEDVDCDEPMVNRMEEVSAKVGDSFKATETYDDTGLAFNDFSALWGDKYSFLTKLQLSIRTKFEQLFGDMSLRETTVGASYVPLEKHWINSAHYDTYDLSSLSKDLLSDAFYVPTN